MAPVTATSVGVTPQVIDDTKLLQLLEKLNSFEVVEGQHHTTPLDIDGLVHELAKWPTWRFEEQADLHFWIHPLNVIDTSLSYLMNKHPALLLIAPLKHTKRTEEESKQSETLVYQAESSQDVEAVPRSVVDAVCTLLRFLTCLLGNAINKNVFNSVEELTDLLAAADDEVAACALEALCSLATPPSLHKQQSPEVHHHTSALHSSKSNPHSRLLAMARGWGSRGSGLGLYACVTADDSEQGQGALPVEAGELTFAFFTPPGKEDARSDGVPPANSLVRIHLSNQDIVVASSTLEGNEPGNDADAVEFSKQKRRRTEKSRRRGTSTKTTYELFFRCLEQAGGRKWVPEDKLFDLLSDIRLAKAFHSSESRSRAVERRLRALTTILHSHPSQDIMSGYFHAQPELCIELIDLLRPTVSSASVSAAAARPTNRSGASKDGDLVAIAALAQSPVVPYSVRTLAVEALTALVARRDAATGGLMGVARQASVLSELGVAKGQYLGLLPTLIRYSLASLSSFLSSDDNANGLKQEEKGEDAMDVDDEALSLEVGLAFLEATKPPSLPPQEQLERALEFIDVVLTLTSAVVSAPSGTAALTDCGLIPALLSTVSLQSSVPQLSDGSSDALSHSICLLRFITAQAIQIVEGAIVTHNNALSAFHDLHGVDILVSRLNREIEEVRIGGDNPNDTSTPASSGDRTDAEILPDATSGRPSLTSARRVLLFSIVNCLTVVFHQESTSSSPSAPAAGTQLRKPELTNALVDIMENVSSYGGVLAALTSSLLSDVMNSDPQVVHHVHKSGLASSFLKMLTANKNGSTLPPVPELIMALPNVISALALTEEGAKAVREVDPFPALLSVFHQPEYAMPKSRCLLSELTAIVGTGLDEIMRHVPSLRPLVMSAVVNALQDVIVLGKDLMKREEEAHRSNTPTAGLETDRTCLMQYALNFGQMLEQILHNEDHCRPFVDAGGLDEILCLYPLLMPTNSQFLAHVSCLSCPSICTIAHSTTEDSLTIAVKSLTMHYDQHKMLQKIIKSVTEHLDVLEESQRELRRFLSSGSLTSDGADLVSDNNLYAYGVLNGLPQDPIHILPKSEEVSSMTMVLSNYLRNVVMLQWLTTLLAGVIRSACQRSQESGTGWGRAELEWKNELSSQSFSQVVDRLSEFHQSALLEACRVRTEEDFESRERARLLKGSRRDRFRLRIVCQEGAVVRDGIEIDSSPSVGSMEMGEVVDAFDRCVNSSGVMRYRTSRGWVSELTRGHGREPIAEVLGVWQREQREEIFSANTDTKTKRTECGVLGIASVSASVLARMQISNCDFFSSLSRLAIQGVRSLQSRSLSFRTGTAGAHAGAVVQLVSSNIEKAFNVKPVRTQLRSLSMPGKSDESSVASISASGASMYLGCMLSLLHACLFLDKRERRTVNVPLLLLLMKSDDTAEESPIEPELSFFAAVRFVFKQSLTDLSKMESSRELRKGSEDPTLNLPDQIVGRPLAASLPPVLALLNRLMSVTLIASSPLTSILSRMKGKDLEEVVGTAIFSSVTALETAQEKVEDCSFQPERFVRALHCTIGETVLEVWEDHRLISFPPHIIHPFAVLVGSIVTGLEQAAKKHPGRSGQGSRSHSSHFDLFSRTAQVRRRFASSRDDSQGEEDGSEPFRFGRDHRFEPSEDAISRLMEMGFGRDHALEALENTRTNRLEIAMEYALSHPPPSPGTIERRRNEREERRRQREERETQRAGVEASADGAEGENSSSAPAGEAIPTNEQPGTSRTDSDPMDVDEESQTTARASSNASAAGAQEPVEDTTDVATERAKSCLRSWIEKSSEVSLNILSGSYEKDGQVEVVLFVDDGKGSGDGEVEAVTVVLSSFVLDLCQGYPEESPRVVLQLLQRLKSHMKEACHGGIAECRVIEGHERAFAALCHAAVLFMRALPKSRVTLLEHGIVRSLVLCTQTLASTMDKARDGRVSPTSWPMWLAPVLLLLDVMAQPLAAFIDGNEATDSAGKEASSSTQTEGELVQVREEHKKQAAFLSTMAKQIFSALRTAAPSLSTNGETDKKDGCEEKTGTAENSSADNMATESTPATGSSSPSSPFDAVPPYFPLIPLESSEQCMELCLRLLGKGRTGVNGEHSSPPPGIVHAALLLLSRVLRSPKLASRCLRMGGAETILNLPRGCRFTGNSGLVTVVLRRLLEDETTLQAAMETEIRGAITKIHGKQSMSRTEERPSVACHSFVQAVTPLISRDPVTFLKAAASSISFEPVAGGSSSRQPKIVLLTADQRAHNVKALSEVLGHGASAITSPGGRNSIQKTSSGNSSSQRRGKSTKSLSQNSKLSKSKSPRSSTKKSRKERNDASIAIKKHIVLNGTPANHVTALLVSRLMTLYHESDDTSASSDCAEHFGEATSFVWIADILEILADLVLALPACAAAIHRYRPNGNKDRWPKSHPIANLRHALFGCPQPPKTVVSFLLHHLLPQDRWRFKKDHNNKDPKTALPDSELRTRKNAYMKSRVSQTSARLLVALVARAGEGRRRVVDNLTYALSGGRLGCASPSSTPISSPPEKNGSSDSELFALHAWGELCIGLASPRSSGAINDNNSSLSYEVVKSMLESGMAHALMYGIQRVKLQHPMAASACAALLIPLEVFTRGSLTDAIQRMADREAADKKAVTKQDGDVSAKAAKKKKSTELELTRGASQRSESAFADDAMLEDGFDAETAARTSRMAIRSGPVYEDAVEMEDTVEEYDDEIDEEDVEMGEDDVADSESSEESDEESSSGGDSNGEVLDEAASVESTDDDNELESEDSGDGSSSDEIEEDENEVSDDTLPGLDEFPNDDFFDGNMNEEPVEDRPPSEAEAEDEWTRIDSSGFGSLMLGGRQSARGLSAGNMSARTRGFIDAAEQMIGTLLRTGELQGDALAEIEDSLGIRIMQHRGPDFGDADRPYNNWDLPPGSRNGSQASTRSRDGRIVGTVPNIQQRNPPDVGYSTLGDGAREVSSMEYVFGGPSISAGSRNYDIVSPRSDVQDDDYPNLSSGDSQLFPGGPAASTHARTRQALHPLLCGVDLPPVNSLVSDLVPHGVRATQRVQTSTRRAGEWSNSSPSGAYFVSTGNGSGSINIRLNRGQNNGTPLSDVTLRQNRTGLVGWTDDGAPFDRTLGEFSDAFERALGESMTPPQDGPARETSNAGSAAADGEQDASSSTRADRALSQEESTTPTSQQQDAVGSTGGENVSDEAGVDSNDPGNSSETARPAPAASTDEATGESSRQQNAHAGNEGNSTTSEGDGVASSLAAGLRLSPRSECSSDQMSTSNATTEHPVIPESSASIADGVAATESAPNVTTEDGYSQMNNDGADNAQEAAENAANLGDDNDEQGGAEALTASDAPQASTENENQPNDNGLVCPPGMDLEVFNSLPLDMQQEVVAQHRTAAELAAQLDSASGLDPEALAALPEEMRREVIEQEQQERRQREQAPADPSNAEEMDNANFVASLAPELREEILLTADEAFLNSLPQNIVAEAHVLRERASARSRRFHEEDMFARSSARGAPSRGSSRNDNQNGNNAGNATNDPARNSGGSRKKQRSGKICVESDRSHVVYLSSTGSRRLTSPFGVSDLKALIRLMYLLNPVRPHRLLQKVVRNLCSEEILRGVLSSSFVRLLNDDGSGASATIDTVGKSYSDGIDWRRTVDDEFSASFDDFPPAVLIGAAPEVLDTDGLSTNMPMFRRRQGSSTAASIAANLPTSARGSSRDRYLPPVVATRIIDTLSHLSKNSLRFCLGVLTNEIVHVSETSEKEGGMTCFDKLLDLLEKPLYFKSSSNLEQLLNLIESVVSPLSHVPKDGDDNQEISQRERDAASSAGKEWVEAPRVAVSQSRLQLLCSILRMESCRDTSFVKVNTIARRLCRVEANRGCILAELASVAQALGADAVRDLKALKIRMNDAAALHQNRNPSKSFSVADGGAENISPGSVVPGGGASSSVTLSTSSSELKLLRVLQTLQGLCIDTTPDEQGGKRNVGVVVTEELVELLQGMNLDDLWSQLTSCLEVVQVLEGVASLEEFEKQKSESGDRQMDMDEDESSDGNRSNGKKLQNSVAGLLTRFLPTIEAFFVANASMTRSADVDKLNTDEDSSPSKKEELGQGASESRSKGPAQGSAADIDSDLDSLVGGRRVVEFVVANRVLLNALIRNNPGLLEKGLRSMVQVSRCRVFLDFDVKRQWFKTQVRRLRQHASRRHGSLRLTIRRKYVFQDAYDQLRIRNADEMRGRLHITFQNEEGVDAGGLSREFFGILAKEMFNPNYALFTSTEDGCTFQPNPNSSINPDHLSYFRFVGRIVGKAVSDGYLLDAHFTRSLYKHMLGLKPTHHDMEAIDPDYYKNLKMILEYNLADIGLDLTFSTEDHSFGRSQIIDLIPDGRRIAVTEETKAKYVSLVCQHRMTTAIQSQIKAYLDGFYELVSRDLIAIFTPKELELLISGLPDIDVHDLKKNTEYQGYKAADKEIGWFWNVMFSLSRSEKAAFLQFATGSSKVPLSGFSELQGMRGVQKFTIHKVGGSSGALMSAHTCFNSLDLPVYKSEAEMREKLLYAISEGGGGFLFA